MNSTKTAQADTGFSLSPSDIYFILFRHKWKIIICLFIGIVAGALTYKLWPKEYVSRAQILIKYVTTKEERVDANGGIETVDANSRVIGTELAILSSVDLATEVNDNLEAYKNTIEGDNEKESEITVGSIKTGLRASSRKGSPIVNLSYSHPNQDITQDILREIINTYLQRHFRIHQDRGTFDDFITQQTDQAKARLLQTEEELISARRAAGLISVEDARRNLSDEISRIRQAINSTDSDLAENQSILTQLTGAVASLQTAKGEGEKEPVSVAKTPEEEQAIADAILEYQRKRTQLDILRAREKGLFAKYTLESDRMQAVLAQIKSIETDLKNLIASHPDAFNTQNEIANAGKTPEEIAQQTRIQTVKVNSLNSRLNRLKQQLQNLQDEATRIDQAELTITELKRRKSFEESQYRTLLANLEKNRMDTARSGGQISNIVELQTPTPGVLSNTVQLKVLGSIVGGGLGVGLAWAFLIELLFNRTSKRPSDIRKFLGVPLFLTLPDTNSRAFKKLTSSSSPEKIRLLGRAKADESKKKAAYQPMSPTLQAAAKSQPEKYSVNSEQNSNGSIAPWDDNHNLHNYFEALRDKVIGYFESRNLTHNPKLVGLTGLGKAPGVTTIAAGLASSLSKTEGGNVLLVDMTLGKESAQQFYKGNVVENIDQAIESKDRKQLSDNLYVVAEGSNGYKLPSILPRRFNSIIPKLKASDFDYIIFDMPAISPISSTPRMASFLDITLMVIESESTDRDVVKQAAELMADSNAHLGAILNKTKSYVPNQLEQDFIGLS